MLSKSVGSYFFSTIGMEIEREIARRIWFNSYGM